MMRVAAYCRVSTDKDSQLNSLENQCRYFCDYINNHSDWELIEVYYDEGVSGTSMKHRKGFNNMLDEVYNGGIDLILTKEVSRFARNTVDALCITRKLRSIGVGVFFINDNINTLESDGELRLTIMASIAQEESRKISERVKWGQKRSMEQGVVFGRSLLGYDVYNGKIFVNNEGAETVKLIFHKYVNEGKGAQVIADELIKSGIRPVYAEKWNKGVILKILRNEKYTGDLCQKKTYTPDFLNHFKKYNKGEEEMVYIKNHHEPIIDMSVWKEAQLILASRASAKKEKTRYSSGYWCSGKIVCGECGKKFVVRKKKRTDNSVYIAWRCVENAKHGSKKANDDIEEKKGCKNNCVNDKVISGSIKHALKLMDIDNKKLLSEIKEEIDHAVKRQNKANKTDFSVRLNTFKRKKKLLLEKYIEGNINDYDYKNQNDHYDRCISDIKIKTEEKSVNQSENDYITDKCIEYVKKQLESSMPYEKLFKEIVEEIIVYKANILEVKLKYMQKIRLEYKVSGRKDYYSVSFMHIS